MKDDDLPPLSDTQRLAKYLGLAEGTLRKWRLVGGEAGPPFVRVGRAVRYRADDVKAWLIQQTVTSTSAGL
jgi:hypothetical protein